MTLGKREKTRWGGIALSGCSSALREKEKGRKKKRYREFANYMLREMERIEVPGWGGLVFSARLTLFKVEERRLVTL